jgi:hypothetical protein
MPTGNGHDGPPLRSDFFFSGQFGEGKLRPDDLLSGGAGQCDDKRVLVFGHGEATAIFVIENPGAGADKTEIADRDVVTCADKRDINLAVFGVGHDRRERSGCGQ